MAKRCIFCGKEYGLFGGGMVLCGDTDEPVCSNCVDELTPLSPTERAERALATGRALYPDELQKFLNRERIQQAKKQARLERPIRPSAQTKPVCGAVDPWRNAEPRFSILAMRVCWVR